MYEISERNLAISERQEVEEEVKLSENTAICQFGSTNAYQGRYYPDIPVKVLEIFPGSDKKNVYIVEALDGSRLLGRAIVPSKALKPFVSEKSRLYSPRFVKYADRASALVPSRTQALQSLLK